jgi:hypothetical protein
MRKGKRMESSEHSLINDDGMQAPLLPQEQTIDDDYHIESASETSKKYLF